MKVYFLSSMIPAVGMPDLAKQKSKLQSTHIREAIETKVTYASIGLQVAVLVIGTDDTVGESSEKCLANDTSF